MFSRPSDGAMEGIRRIRTFRAQQQRGDSTTARPEYKDHLGHNKNTQTLHTFPDRVLSITNYLVPGTIACHLSNTCHQLRTKYQVLHQNQTPGINHQFQSIRPFCTRDFFFSGCKQSFSYFQVKLAPESYKTATSRLCSFSE